MAGALNGPDAALGINIKNGVQMAIDKHNAANPGCQVQLKPFDTEGDPQKATAIAPQIVDDQYTIGLVADSACNISVKKGDKDFSAAVTQVKGASPDAVFYGGYYSEAAPLVQQLKDGGVTAS